MSSTKRSTTISGIIMGWIAVVATPLAVALSVAVFALPDGTHRWGAGWVLVDSHDIRFVDRDWQPDIRISTGLWLFALWLPLTLWLFEVVRLRMRKAMNWDRFDLSRKGICWKCGYDLRGTREHRCPECGSINGRGDLIWADANRESLEEAKDP